VPNAGDNAIPITLRFALPEVVVVPNDVDTKVPDALGLALPDAVAVPEVTVIEVPVIPVELLADTVTVPLTGDMAIPTTFTVAAPGAETTGRLDSGPSDKLVNPNMGYRPIMANR